MTSYQFFTHTTVTTAIFHISAYLPSIGAWLASRLDVIIFIHSFAWIFLLASVIPSVILGKERSVLVQFGVCLALTLLTFLIQDALAGLNGTLDQILGLAPIFHNPLLAAAYLAIPYLLMIGFDINGKLKNQRSLRVESETDDFSEDTFIVEDDFNEKEKTQEEEWIYQY
jgi:hypothetical protein